jgi:hypothetical protein
MDLLKNLASGSSSQHKEPPKQEPHGIMDSLHGLVGGGRQSEQKEDALDKGPLSPCPYLLSDANVWK